MNKRLHRLVPPHPTQLQSPETRSRRQHPVGKAAPVAGGADPGRLAVRLSERFFGLRISGFAAIVLKNVAPRGRSTPADETSAFPGGR
jgi:hypothetical protein